MKIKDIRASVHGFSITVLLLEVRVEGYGRAEQTHFVFCEVETDEGIVGYGLTGHGLTLDRDVWRETRLDPAT